MKKQRLALFVLGAALGWGGAHAATDSDFSMQGVLTSAEESTLMYMREEEKLARDTYSVLYDVWGYKVFLNISRAEQNHMDAMLKMLDKYAVTDPVVDNSVGAFEDPAFTTLFAQLVERGEAGLLEAFMVGGYIEEMDIRDLTAALAETNEPSLTNAYSNLLAASRNHLRTFVSHVRNLDVDYEAQVLSQDAVDTIVGDFDVTPPQGFTMNAGLNDAWYFPETSGQGFFLTVFPGQQKVFLGWFTYDTELPDESVSANLGDPGHRWITAQGSFAGAQAELVIDMTSGGLFDSPEVLPEHESGGSILLQFDDCMSGSLYYDIPSIGRSDIVPIRRICNDNVALCETLAASAASTD
jgi:hypothetical protein